MEQQQSYGIPYAMHIHDIERIERVEDWQKDDSDGEYKNMINIRLEQGWKILHLATDTDTNLYATMGVPRPHVCSRYGCERIQKWNNKLGEWECEVKEHNQIPF